MGEYRRTSDENVAGESYNTSPWKIGKIQRPIVLFKSATSQHGAGSKMAPAKEVLTFQIGHYSNFIGSHWWNLQVSIYFLSLFGCFFLCLYAFLLSECGSSVVLLSSLLRCKTSARAFICIFILKDSSFVFRESEASSVEVDHDVLYRQGCAAGVTYNFND